MRLLPSAFLMLAGLWCAALVVIVDADYYCGGGTALLGSCQPYSKVDDQWMKNEDWIGRYREYVIDAGPKGDEGCREVCTRQGYSSGCCGWYDDNCWCK